MAWIIDKEKLLIVKREGNHIKIDESFWMLPEDNIATIQYLLERFSHESGIEYNEILDDLKKVSVRQVEKYRTFADINKVKKNKGEN